MPKVVQDASELEALLNKRLRQPDQIGYWRNLSGLRLPGLKFVGHFGVDKLSPGDLVVALTHSKDSANPALVVGRVSSSVVDFGLCVPIDVHAVLTPKDESPEKVGIQLGKSYLFGGFQVFKIGSTTKTVRSNPKKLSSVSEA